MDSARSLTDAWCGVIITLDGKGQVEDFLASGLTDEETQHLFAIPEGPKIFEHLTTIPGPLRIPDFASYLRSQDLPKLHLPTQMSACLVIPIRHRGEHVGHIYLAKSEPGQEFPLEDEDTLVMFASQAALVIRQRSPLSRRAAGQSRLRNPDQYPRPWAWWSSTLGPACRCPSTGSPEGLWESYRRRDAPWNNSST